MITIEQERILLRSALRLDFKSFVMKVFNEVSPNDQYLDSWYIDYICNILMDIFDGKLHRSIINIPPRYMKSTTCSVSFPAFILGHNPKASIIVVSYADELSSDLANKCKKVIESTWYQEIFPGTRLSKSKKATNDFETTKGGGRFATSIGGTLTGRGGDYVIIDDPIKPDDANSDTMREKTNNWFGSTLSSRLNNKNTGNIILVMQRFHEEDLTGYLLKTDSSYKHVKIPAIAEEDEAWAIKDRITGREKTFIRNKGEALHPERENITMLLKNKKTMGEYNFAGQYQQNPAPREGGIIKEKWFQYYNKEKLLEAITTDRIEIKCIIQSWDTANKIEENNDYSVCITILRDTDNKNYVLDCYREKLEFPALIKKVVQLHNLAKEEYRNKIDLLIEDQASGTQIIQTLKSDYTIYPKSIKAEHDKESRLRGVSHLIENGSCLFPDNNPSWWLDFEKELLMFPKGKHDDQCDALSQALNYRPNEYQLSYSIEPVNIIGQSLWSDL